MRKAKLLAIMLFLLLVSEHGESPPVYTRYVWTPVGLSDWFIERLPGLRVSLFEIACFILLLVTPRKPVARPLLHAVQVSFGTVIFMIAYGQVTGGVLEPIYTQTHSWLAGLLFAITAMRVLSSADDFARMADAIVLATIWRSFLAIVCFLKVRNLPWNSIPQYMTTHEDSVLFAVGLTILVSRAVEYRSKNAVRKLVLWSPLVFAAMKYNNRRLVWVALVASLIVIYFILPASSKVGRRINRAMRILVPILLIYAAVGWGRSEAIFRPLRTFASMSSAKQADGTVDLSTKARDNENEGTLAMVLDRPILGTGLGHEFVLLDTSGAVPPSVFPMYKFSPHNSVLALLAFTGGLGFVGMWTVIAVAVYLLARTYRKSHNPTERSVAIMGISAAIAYLNQSFGDMGLIHFMPSTLLGLSFACAARLSITSGGWSSGSKSREVSGAESVQTG